MHRADQIVDAVVTAIRAWGPGSVRVFAHRRLSLNQDEAELPAISVDYGEDVPADDLDAFDMSGNIGSLLTVNVTGLVMNHDEKEVRRLLLELRALVHAAINRTNNLELAFVSGIFYGGALPPEVDVANDQVIGELTSQWGIRYRMTINSAE